MLLFYGQSGPLTLTTASETGFIELAAAAAALTATGTVTSGSPTITALTSLAGVAIGDEITAAGVTPGTTVLAADDAAHQVTMSANATASHVAESILFGDASLVGFADAVVMLYTGTIVLPQKAPTVVSLGEATYGGYARSTAIVWGPTIINPDLDPFITGDKKSFVATDAVTPNVITGAAILAVDGTTVLQVCPFPNPVSMALAGQGLDFVPVLSLVPQS